MRASVVAIGGLVAVVGSFWAYSSSESQTVRFDFATDAQGWEALPSSNAATLRAVTDSGASGGHALEIRYRVEKGKLIGVRRAVGRLDGAGVRVGVKTDAPTVIVLGLIEADGSAYNKAITTTRAEWQLISAPFSEFTLADDSKDENGRLDVGSVRALLIIDAAGFVSDATGERRLWVANYEIGGNVQVASGAAPSSSSAAVWDFEEGSEGWIPVPPPGGAAVQLSATRVTGNASAGSGALQIRYRVERKKVAGVLRPVNGLAGVGVRTVVRTRVPTVVVLGLIERDGSAYNSIVRTEADAWQEVDLLFQNFALADDSKDENRRLDPDQVQALVVGDAAGFVGTAEGDGELLVGKYEIVSEPAPASVSSGRAGPGGYRPLLATGVPTDAGARATAGISYVPGKFSQGFLTDAPGELVAMPTRGLKRDEGTIELWISPQFDMRNVRDFTALVSLHAEPFATGFKTSLLIFYSKEQKIVFLTNGDTERAVATRTLDWKAGEWHHLAASWGPRGNRLYLDGRVAGENRRGDPPAAVASDIVLGNHSWSLLSARFANTVIDEFRLSSAQRSDDEIATSTRAERPFAPDERTVALAHFDRSPAPPLTLTPETEPFHARSPGRSATWVVAASDPFPPGSSVTYSVSTASGTTVEGGTLTAPAGRERVEMSLSKLASPGFYRLVLGLDRGGALLNQGQDWIRILPSGRPPATGAASFLFGAAASTVDSVDNEAFFQHAAAAGARSVRLPFEWAEIEPRDDQFVWDRYDRIVAWAKRHGIEVVPTLFWENPQPAWAGRGKANAASDDIYPPERMRAWDDFVFRVVARYKNDIRWWIPANEPNLTRYWYPKPDARAYVALLKATREAALRADPDAKMLGLSTSGVDLRFLEEAFTAGALEYCDAVGLHPYRAPFGPDARVPINILDPGSSPGTFLDAIRAVRRLMDQHGGSRKKLWLDEIGQPYRDDFITPNWGVSEDTAATYLVKTYVDSTASGDVDRVLWYALWGGEYGSFSLLTPDGRPTLPFVAYAAAAERLGGATVAGEGGRGADIRSVKFTSATESIEIVWALRGSSEIALQPGERALDVYGFPLDEANGVRRLKVTTAPSWIVRPKS